MLALDFGDFNQRPEELETFRVQTIDCIYRSLMGPSNESPDLEALAPSNLPAQSLVDIGIALRMGSASSK